MNTYLHYFLYQPLSQFEITLGNSNILTMYVFSLSYFLIDDVKNVDNFFETLLSYAYLKHFVRTAIQYPFHYFCSMLSFAFSFDFGTQVMGPKHNHKDFLSLIEFKNDSSTMLNLKDKSYYNLACFLMDIKKYCLNPTTKHLREESIFLDARYGIYSPLKFRVLNMSPFDLRQKRIIVEPDYYRNLLSYLVKFFSAFAVDLITLKFSNLIKVLYCFTLIVFLKIFQFSIYFFNTDVYVPFFSLELYKNNLINVLGIRGAYHKYFTYHFIDYSITKFHTTVFFILFFFFIFFVLNLKKEFFFRPSVNFIIFGLIDKFLTNTIMQQLGIKRGQEFSAVLKTFFFLILFANLFGLIPFSFTITSHLVFTFGLSFAIISTITIFGFYKQGFRFLNLLIPGGAPKALLPILIPIELLSYIVRCFSLAIRLFANMMSGHSLLYILSGFVIQITAAGFFLIALAPFFIVLLIGILEIGVAMLQAYVFLVLTCIYLRDGYQAGH